MKKLLLILGIFVLVQVVFAGYWSEVTFDPDVDPECNGLYHVMCAEKDTSGARYDSLNRNISYTNQSGAQKTLEFCAIVDREDSPCEFEMIDGSNPLVDIYNLSALKDYTGLCEEIEGSVSYNGYVGYYDENCDGDEMFEMNYYGILNTTRYIENNVTYDVSNRNSNIDFFDIIVEGVGAVLAGTIYDTNGNFVNGSNVTIYFDNGLGTFKPYRSYMTGVDGSYTTKNDVDIETYFRNVTTNLIPRTDYVVIVKHPEYLDSVTEISVGIGNFTVDDGGDILNEHNVTLTPVNFCENDCTFSGSNLCRRECHGINDCEFKFVGSENLGDYLNGLPSGITVQKEVDEDFYEIDTCEGDAILIEQVDVSLTKGPDCPSDQEVWKTTQLVRLNGQVVKMVVTLCQ